MQKRDRLIILSAQERAAASAAALTAGMAEIASACRRTGVITHTQALALLASPDTYAVDLGPLYRHPSIERKRP